MSVPELADRVEISLFDFDLTELIQVARRKRLGIGLCLVGWFHLLSFGVCELLYSRGDRAAAHFLPLWIFDAGMAMAVIRRCIPTVGSFRSSRSIQVMFRVWVTFAILCLTSASLNTITGFQIDWFKISWAMLSTFGFATMAWIFHLAFLIPAVQMSLTALLIASHPDHAYAIFGVSWFLTLQGMGLFLERSRLIPWSFQARSEVTVVMRRDDREA